MQTNVTTNVWIQSRSYLSRVRSYLGPIRRIDVSPYVVTSGPTCPIFFFFISTQSEKI